MEIRTPTVFVAVLLFFASFVHGYSVDASCREYENLIGPAITSAFQIAKAVRIAQQAAPNREPIEQLAKSLFGSSPDVNSITLITRKLYARMANGRNKDERDPNYELNQGSDVWFFCNFNRFSVQDANSHGDIWDPALEGFVPREEVADCMLDSTSASFKDPTESRPGYIWSRAKPDPRSTNRNIIQLCPWYLRQAMQSQFKTLENVILDIDPLRHEAPMWSEITAGFRLGIEGVEIDAFLLPDFQILILLLKKLSTGVAHLTGRVNWLNTVSAAQTPGLAAVNAPSIAWFALGCRLITPYKMTISPFGQLEGIQR